jgi:2-methylcitrate dehydratase PrpD
MVNGASGHADDYDDTQLSTAPNRIYGLMTHPTVPVLSAALALGESMDCSGEELLEAFVAGFEVECKLAEAIKPDHYRRGFHSTGTLGTFGAWAAVGVLMSLGEKELRHSLGIAASLSSGIRANFGTMTKPLHAGMAASNGVIACSLGAEGFTADPKVLDGRWGFMKILGGGADPEFLVDKLGNPYAIVHPGATVKMYPCGSLGQPSMDAMLDIVIEENLRPGEVREIRLKAGPNILEPLRYDEPVDELQAKFSLQFGLASILLRRRAGLREYSMKWVNDPQLREAMRRVRTIYDEDIAGMGMDRMRSFLEVELVDGRVIKRIAERARGTPEKPLKPHELDKKFMECATFRLSEDKAKKALEVVKEIEGLDTVGDLMALL